MKMIAGLDRIAKLAVDDLTRLEAGARRIRERWPGTDHRLANVRAKLRHGERRVNSADRA